MSKCSKNLELISVTCDYRSSWENDPTQRNVFKQKKKGNLILNWVWENDTNTAAILNEIGYNAIILPKGLSGKSIPQIVNPILRHTIKIRFNSGYERLSLYNQRSFPKRTPFQFQTELIQGERKKNRPMEGRFYIDFVFSFSYGNVIQSPRLFFNCDSENQDLPLYGLG